jgi:hypothetical protein
MGQNVLAVYLVVKQVEALFRFVLRLTIQLDLKFSDTTWCCQTHRQSPSFPLSQAHQQARALCSASITRPQRSYDPLRRPRPTAVLSDDVRRRDLRQSWTSPNYPDHLPCMLCSLPRWIGSGALIGCPLPCTVRPSPLWQAGRHPQLTFEACSSFTRLRPAGLLIHHSWALSRGSVLRRFPGFERSPATKSYRQLLGWVLPPLVFHAFGAHCINK